MLGRVENRDVINVCEYLSASHRERQVVMALWLEKGKMGESLYEIE